jgi:hypothetical protein
LEFRIEGVAKPIAQKVDGKNEERERDPRECDDPPITREEIAVAN